MIRFSNQADGLRGTATKPGRVIPFRRRSFDGERRTIAVTSGKGGVGKTQISANLAVGFARAGRSVVVLDADLGLASMDLAFGVRPEADLRDVLEGRLSMREVLVEGPLGVKLVPACPGRYDMANLPPTERRRLLDAVSDVAASFDVLLIDTGAGIGGNAVAFASHADEVVLVTTPDPTALRDAYAMAKVLHRRSGVDRVRMVANQVRSEAEGAELHENLDSIVRRFLSLELDYLGAVPRDEEVKDAVRSGEPFVLASPSCPASRALASITRRLMPENAPRELC